MKEEIKEILDYVFSLAIGEAYTCDYEDIQKARDYITNLQEENVRYKKLFEGKERFSKIMPDDMDFIVMSKTDYDRQVDDIELVALELRSRIDKAISLLKEAGCYDEETKTFCDDVWEELPDLLNILQGGEEK